jgi:aldose 1-epimerase
VVFKKLTIKNKLGFQATLTNYGATLTSLLVPGRQGKLGEVVLGYDTPQEYKSIANPYFGGTIGRYANRIGQGRFSLNDVQYQLACNDRGNHLHGGVTGFNQVFWDATQHENRVEFRYTSAHMEEGYPGELEIFVCYAVNDHNELLIDYLAETSEPTMVNLTNHSYFNLTDAGHSEILDHELWIDADCYTPVDAQGIPTGVIAPVTGTAFDFRSRTRIGERIEQSGGIFPTHIGGYDHNWILNRKGNGLELLASVYDPVSGRLLEVLTTQPGLQFYSGEFLDDAQVGRGGMRHPLRTGLCLETQHYPDSPNHLHFPSTVLRPGERYSHRTIYRFRNE